MLPLNLTKFVPLLLTSRNVVPIQKVHIFLPFPQNVANAKFEQRDGNGKVVGKIIEKWMGTLTISILLLFYKRA